jgi:hypothetical protein
MFGDAEAAEVDRGLTEPPRHLGEGAGCVADAEDEGVLGDGAVAGLVEGADVARWFYGDDRSGPVWIKCT